MPKPQIIKDVGFDFSWDVSKVWILDVPEEEVSIEVLLWHFHIPFLGWKNRQYNLTPFDVLTDPITFKTEHQRVQQANLLYPIDIMENKGRWLILDGLHRLMKAFEMDCKTVKVRKIPRKETPKIINY